MSEAQENDEQGSEIKRLRTQLLEAKQEVEALRMESNELRKTLAKAEEDLREAEDQLRYVRDNSGNGEYSADHLF